MGQRPSLGLTVSEEGGFLCRKGASVCCRHCSHILASAESSEHGVWGGEHKRQAQQRPLQVGKAKSALIAS